MDTVVSLLGRNGFLPHGVCFTWSPWLLWTMVVANGVIAAAYFSIPVAIGSYVRRRPEAGAHGLAGLFCAFIFACGLTHVMHIWTIWQPDYALQALALVITAVVSLVTAVALWPLIPRALKIPSVQQLQQVIGSLESEIGRRRSAEDQLVAIQQSLAVTLASIDAGFIATDRAGLVTHMNAVAELVTGWSQNEALGQALWTVFVREDQPSPGPSGNPVDQMLAQGTTVASVQHLVALSRSGAGTPLELKAALTRGDDGQIIGLAMVFRDMSRLRVAEAESQRLAAIVASSSDAIIGKTLDGRITSWNGAAQAIFGHSAAEAIGQPVQMLIPPELQHEEMRILANLAHGDPVPPFDTVRLTRSGERLEVSISISPIRDGAGRVVGASKIARDVSRQRRAEAALRDSEERLRFTLEAAHIGDWTLDLATGVMQHSLRHDRCFGHSTLQAAWNFDTFIAHVHPDDRDEVSQTLHVAVTELRDWRVQCRVVWPDGSVHWISKHGSVQRKDGRATRMLGIVSEITEQRQAEDARLTAQRLEAENRQIQEANRLKSQFLANMSHELRTPLNAVIGFADLLHAGLVKPDSPKHQEFLGHIGNSGRHLLQLINDVLDLSKVESGKFEFFPEPVQLPQLLDEVLGILHTAVQRKAIHISTEIADGLGDLVLDPARLKQVFYNYLSNAIKFTPAGGHVTLRALAEGPDHFRVEVEDTGIGIAAADLPRLFTEFLQLDAGYSKQHQGTGLGLALTRRLVQAQGGQVGVRSTPGVGSCFSVVLNRVHGVDARRAAAATPGEPVRGVERVLVIAHDQHHQTRLVAAWSEAGFVVDAAADGPHALRRAHDTAYAALSLDLRLPDQPGLGLLADIRSRGASQAAPVLSLSVPVGQDSRAAFAIADVLCKPLRSDELWSAMAGLRQQAGSRAKVVVVDDDPAALDLMQATLQSMGIAALCFQDGRSALAQLDQLRPDAMVLDLMMPGFDGFQVLDALQRLPAWQQLPVFIWTSMLLTDEEYALLARSARAILRKGGGSLEAVLDSVRRWRPLAVPAADPS
ncbi:MAG: PAS domain S-box protein [Pseudomonadota bacterium]